MKTKRTLLAGLAGLFITGVTALAGVDSWKRPPQMPKPKAGCCAVCLPAGACCDITRARSAPGSGHESTRVIKVGCKDSCAMPHSGRNCCMTMCAH